MVKYLLSTTIITVGFSGILICLDFLLWFQALSAYWFIVCASLWYGSFVCSYGISANKYLVPLMDRKPEPSGS